MNYASPRDADLHDLIGAIYDCVIDPSLWRGTIDRIRQRFDFHNGIFGVNGVATNEIVFDIAINIPDAMYPIMLKYSPQAIDMWGGWARIAAVPLEEPLLQSQVRPSDWTDLPYYKLFVAPQGIVDSLAIPLVRDAHTVANINFGIHGSRPALTEAELDELRVLARHLRRAVVIGRLLESSMGAAANFADALDAAAVGVALVDRTQRVVHANRAAATMLSAGDPIRVAGGRLELATELAPGAFSRAIETAGTASPGGNGAGVPARRLNGQPLAVQIMPLEQRREANTPSGAAVAVFVSEASGGPATSAEILGVLFDLTPAEARIFTLVVGGQGVAEIGTQLSISPATAKKHLGNIYKKTGQNSQAGLVKLAQDVAPPA